MTHERMAVSGGSPKPRSDATERPASRSASRRRAGTRQSCREVGAAPANEGAERVTVAAVRVLFASTQGAGHFNPLVPFVEAYRRAGHEVLVVGPPVLAERAETAGFPFRAGARPPDDVLGPIWGACPGCRRPRAT